MAAQLAVSCAVCYDIFLERNLLHMQGDERMQPLEHHVPPDVRPRRRLPWLITALLLFSAALLGLVPSVVPPVRAQPPLPQPANIKCEGFERDTVRIFWRDTADDESNYRIERSVDGGAFTEIDTLTPDSEGRYSPFRDTGIDTSQNLRYRLRSFRSSDNSFSPFSDVCNNRRIRETNNFRIFYGLRGSDDCPLVDGNQVCLDDAGSNDTLSVIDQSLEGSLAAFNRIGFSRDASNQRGGLDKPPINITWCDGGGCAGVGGAGTAMGLAPSLIETGFDLLSRTGDPIDWLVPEHELLHLQQFQYDGLNDPAANWVYEGQARMSQDKICIGADTSTCINFDDIDTGYAGYVPQVKDYLGNPNRPVIETSYSAALFWTYITEKYGTSNTVPGVETGMNLVAEFWDQVVANTNRDGVANLNDALAALGHSERFRDIWKDFAVASYAKDFSGSGVAARYQYEDVGQPGGSYGAPGLSLSRTLSPGDQVIDTDETVTQWGARYYELRPDASLPIIDIAFTQDSSYPLYYTILGIQGNDITYEYNFEGRNLAQTLLNNSYDRVVIIVAGLDYQANYRYSINGTLPELNIVTPTSGNRARVGDPAAPDKFLVKVEIVTPDGTPFPNVDLADFSFTVGTQSVNSSQILTSAQVQNQQWFVLRAPTQSSAGTYDLTVAYGGALSATNSDAGSYIPRNDTDNVLILDRSGSMADAGKLEAAQAAARLYVDSWRSGDQVGLVSFNASTLVELTLRAWTNTSRNQAISEINSLTATGGTAIGDALRTGWNEVINRGDSGHDQAMILLSDGLETAGSEDFEDLINELADDGGAPAVHTVAVGPDADRLLMQRLASRTGGTYQAVAVPADTALAAAGTSGNLSLDLSARYRAIATEVDGQEQFYSQIGPINSPNTFEDRLNIPVEGSVPEMVLSLSLDDDTGIRNIIQLRDPAGNPVEATLIYTEDSIDHYVWQISNPTSGNWQLYIAFILLTQQQDEAAPQQTNESVLPDYLVQASLRSDLNMDVFLATPVDERDPGVPMRIIAGLTDTAPVTGATVRAAVTDPNGAVRQVTLFDDGNHDDGAANDGLYGGSYYQTGTPGSYSVLVTASGNGNSGAAFAREQLLAFFISGVEGSRNDPPFNEPTRTPPDRDSDGLPDAWEEENGTDPDTPDADRDNDQDGWDNSRERDEGTDPRNSDTDGDGEADSSDSDPLDPAEPRLDPVRVVGYPGNGKVTVRYTPRPAGDTVRILRAPQFSGPYVQIATDSSPDDGEYDDSTAGNGNTYCYTVVVISGGRRYATPTPDCTEPKVDYLAPTGGVVINGNTDRTSSPDVRLTLFATDFFDPELNEDGDAGPPDDTASGVTEMLISNNADMRGASWEPYQRSRNWRLAQQTGLASVFVKYRDAAGNESEVYPASIDIISAGSGSRIIYVPAVYR